MVKEVKEVEVVPTSNGMATAVINLYEKVAREYQLTPDEVKASTITVKNGEVTVKGKK